MWKLVSRLGRLVVPLLRLFRERPVPLSGPEWLLFAYDFESDWYVKVSDIIETVEKGKTDVSIRFSPVLTKPTLPPL